MNLHPSRSVSLHRTILKLRMKMSLCLTIQHAMKTDWGVEVQLHEFLTLVSDGGQWSASCPGRFRVKEISPLPHIPLVGRWGRPHIQPEHYGEEKNPHPLPRFMNLWLQSLYPSCYTTELSLQVEGTCMCHAWTSH